MSANNDLNLLKLLKHYEPVDEDVAKAVYKGFLTHLQYLDRNLIALCLFDENLDLTDKRNVIRALHTSGKGFVKISVCKLSVF